MSRAPPPGDIGSLKICEATDEATVMKISDQVRCLKIVWKGWIHAAQ